VHKLAYQEIVNLITGPRELDFSKLDLAQTMTPEEYAPLMSDLQLALVNAQRKVGDYGMRVIVVFEGMDAAGKGGAIKRLTEYLDPRGVRVHSLGPPSSAEEPHHYLRRFWMRLPKRGRITIFDDYSWYSRMLLDPVEGYCTPEEYARAPRQIRDFELTLAEEGYLLIKFWIHVDRREQLQRFKRRLNNPYKFWKLTPEDWRNRELWNHYLAHAQRMITETDAPYAPWLLVAGNDKLHARVNVLRYIVTLIEGWQVGSKLFTSRHEYLKYIEEHGDFLDDDD
jgi:polyphosphate kinase 2 (PPK2 family)